MSDRRVHLYEFGIGAAPRPSDWAALSAVERARAAAIADGVRRDRFVVRRAALHAILGRHPGRFWSASDSGHRAVVAVAGRPVGVDIELERPRRAQERIARRMFAADERAVMAASAGEERRRVFHRCWVAKEAYAKGLGRGLALRFDAFSVAQALASEDGCGAVGDDWSVRVGTQGEVHVAVAAMGHDWEIVRGG